MTTRCKVTVQSVYPGRGSTKISFSPVYEQTDELKKVSENAKFGWASPSLYMNLVGPIPDVFRPTSNAKDMFCDDEWYIDITKHQQTSDDIVLQLACRKRYQRDPSGSNDMTAYQIVVEHPEIHGSLDISVQNPVAVELLNAFERGFFVWRKARTRRSHAEVVALEKYFVEQEKHFDQYNKKAPEEREQALYDYRYTTLRKIAIAKGEDPDALLKPTWLREEPKPEQVL